MNKIPIILLLLGLTLPAMTQISIRPQVGFNSSNLTKDFNNADFINDNGFQFGVDLQMGERFYFQPGILWESASNEIRNEIDGNNTSFNVNRIRIPVMIGYKLLGPDADGLIDARIFTGPNAAFVVSKDLKQTALIDKEDFRNAIYGWNFGVGFDLAIVFVDVGYSFGLSEVFENAASTARNNLFYVNGGLRIGF